MDEYLFITMAKLKADRLRLEREQRAHESLEERRQQRVETHQQPARTGWFAHEHQWREQS